MNICLVKIPNKLAPETRKKLVYLEELIEKIKVQHFAMESEPLLKRAGSLLLYSVQKVEDYRVLSLNTLALASTR